MPEVVSAGELHSQTSRIIRNVREVAAEFVVTWHGEPVALLRPVTETEKRRLLPGHVEEVLSEMKSLAQQVATAWTSDQTGVELVAQQRR